MSLVIGVIVVVALVVSSQRKSFPVTVHMRYQLVVLKEVERITYQPSSYQLLRELHCLGRHLPDP